MVPRTITEVHEHRESQVCLAEVTVWPVTQATWSRKAASLVQIQGRRGEQGHSSRKLPGMVLWGRRNLSAQYLENKLAADVTR